MKTTAKLLTVTLGVLLVLTMVGCPKKCVTPTEPISVPPPPDTIVDTPPEPPKFEGSLAAIHFDFDKSDVSSGAFPTRRLPSKVTATRSALPSTTWRSACAARNRQKPTSSSSVRT
jgi:hypothetical protein